MTDVRWLSRFEHTIPFTLFHKHFTEINDAYWAYVPAASTIEKKALEHLQNEAEDPRKYFLIPDEDDRRIASKYSEWKANFREFGNYTRLNIIMLLSSCFETYLRTVVSLAFESKPACTLGCPNRIDGAFLLKTKNGYIKSKLLQTWSPKQIANTPWEKALPSTRTIYRWIYEKYIDVNLKVLRRKGKSREQRKQEENTTAGKRSESGIRASTNGWNSDIGKQIPSYPDEENRKHVLQLWLNERRDSTLQSRCRIRVQTAW
jgi:hypothetical protein